MPTRRSLEAGTSYRFLGVPGESEDAERTPLGADANALFPGQVVTIREVVDAGEPGAHDDSEDAVVIEWTMPSLVRGDNGWEQGEAPRAVSIGLSEFPTMFEEA